ncbi:MAG: hypothetical protein ACRCX2_12500 [Paraclostridium sp.]
MIVVKFKYDRIKGFKDDTFIIDDNFFLLGTQEIEIDEVKEIIVDGNTIYQSEVV